MKRITFKLIPFLISLFIVIGSVTGICLYSYYNYENNKLRFVADYFHYEDYSSVDTQQQIEDFIKFQSVNYQVVNNNLTYSDVKSGLKYKEAPLGQTAKKNKFNDATWKDGILEIPGYFKIKAYGMTTYNKDAKKFVYSYYFYLFDVNYENVNVDDLYLVFVDGNTDNPEDGKLYGLEKLDLALDEIKSADNGGANTVNLQSYKYSGKSVTSYSMYIHDNNAKNYKGQEENEIPYVYRLTTLSETLLENDKEANVSKESRTFSELPTVTFSIFDSHGSELGEKMDEMEELVRGEYTAEFTKAEDFNKAAESNKTIMSGANGVIYDAGYGKFIWLRITIQGLGTLLISGALAVLFYLIWQDDPEQQIKTKTRQKIKKARK